MRNAELLRQQVYERIKRDILVGVYQAGEQLSANQIAEKYQISATPIREALNVLQQEGLIQVLPRVGYFVTQITLKDISDLFGFRILIEGASAELAAQHITEEEIDALERIPIDYIEGDPESYWDYVQNNRMFHQGIARASRNQWIERSVVSILDQMSRLVFMGLDAHDYSVDIIEHHPRVISALRSRDSLLSKQVMIEGIEKTRQAVLQAMMQRANVPIHP